MRRLAALFPAILLGCTSPQPMQAPQSPSPMAMTTVGMSDSMPPNLRRALLPTFRGTMGRSFPAYDSGGRGSFQAPIEANGPLGQQEYLSRLVCPNKQAPDFRRIGSYGAGPDGHIEDGYAVYCPPDGPTYHFYMDMYHKTRDTLGVGPFKAYAVLPIRALTGCPPDIASLGLPPTRAFLRSEVSRPALLMERLPESIDADVEGTVRVWVVVDTTGRVRGNWESDVPRDKPALLAAVKGFLPGIAFQPAEHHPGCLVPMEAVLRLRFAKPKPPKAARTDTADVRR
ncbi:MAG: hypothetical protein HY275_02055 [Gemmatimonadetes bacterium]|nr:hypothetical protein [Gemmatimonadota bacterium]